MKTQVYAANIEEDKYIPQDQEDEDHHKVMENVDENNPQDYEDQENPTGSQYESQQEEYPLEQFEEYNGYEQYPSDDVEEMHAMCIAEENSNQMKRVTASLRKIEPEEIPVDVISRSSLNRVVGTMS